ncbi:hypothetical protein Hanom_Chr06g00527311 [Helianthus anomalus]
MAESLWRLVILKVSKPSVPQKIIRPRRMDRIKTLKEQLMVDRRSNGVLIGFSGDMFVSCDQETGVSLFVGEMGWVYGLL